MELSARAPVAFWSQPGWTFLLCLAGICQGGSLPAYGTGSIGGICQRVAACGEPGFNGRLSKSSAEGALSILD